MLRVDAAVEVGVPLVLVLLSLESPLPLVSRMEAGSGDQFITDVAVLLLPT